MIRNRSIFAVAWILAGSLAPCSLGGCSSGTDQQSGPALAPPAAAASSAPVAPPAYQLSEKELKMSCKSLTGSMKVRILQMQTESEKNKGTMVARGMQAGAIKIWGGPTYGTDPNGEASRDRAQLEAYNQQLAAKKCKTLDLQAEIQAASAKTKAP